MLLSDRDILAAQADGHISLDPWTPEMVQPASIDVRLDRFFRLFNNHAYTYVDPAENQGALTEQFEVASDEPWILHPSTLPVKLWPGMKIGQMCFFQLSSPAEHPYGSKETGSHYQGQRGPTPSRSYVNFYKADITD